MRLRWLMAILVGFTLILGCSDDDTESRGKPPTVEISYPEEGQILTSTRITVTGLAENTETIEVNGVTADVLNGEWEVLVDFDAEGDVMASAVAGEVTDEVNFVIDSLAPDLKITSPERGHYADAEMLTVQGTVSDAGSGMNGVIYNGAAVEVAADGSFTFDVPLEVGLNQISVTATDNAGNEANALRGVMWGEFDDPTATLEPAFNIFVRTEALDTIEEVVEAMITPEFVTSFINDSFAVDGVTIDAVRFDPIDVEITPRAGILDLYLGLTNLELEGSFTIGDTAYPTTITIVQMSLEVEMDITPAADGSIEFAFGVAQLNLADEDLLFTIQDLTQDDVQFLRNLVVDVVTQAFGGLLSQTVFDQLLDPDVLKRELELLGRKFVFELAITEVSIFTDGILVKTAMTLPADKFAAVRDVPGALKTVPSNPNGPNTKNDIIFSTNRNVLDHILHGVWRSGLLHQELRGDDFGGFDLPFNLSAGALALVLDKQISSLASNDTPVSVTLRPLLPPVIEMEDGNIVKMQIAELMLDLKLILPEGDMLIASIAVFLDLGVDIQVDGVVVKLNFDTAALADLDAEPEIDLNDKNAEALIERLVALIPSLLSQSLDIRGKADITWVLLENAEIEVHGLEQDHLSVSLSMSANPDGVAPE